MDTSDPSSVRPRTQFIAEVADNHGGDMELAKTFIRRLAAVGVDYVKFQSWRMARVRDPAAEPHYAWLTKAELTDAQHAELKAECERRKVKFLTTVFDAERVDFVASLGLDTVKIGSAEVSDHALLAEARRRFPHIILSTGMHTLKEVARAAEILKRGRLTLMHCVSIYPCGIEQANLARMERLRWFTPSVGFSDHSVGLEAAKMAIVLGADYVERHSCLSPEGPGRVNPWDTSPEQWAELAKYRDLVSAARGTGDAPLGEAELRAKQRFVGRWSGPAVSAQRAEATAGSTSKAARGRETTLRMER